MATQVEVSRTNAQGQQVLSALSQIRDGLAILEKLDGSRAEAISAGNGGAANFEAKFGVTAGGGQALSDRWGALLAAYADTGNAEYAKLRDIINATFATTT